SLAPPPPVQQGGGPGFGGGGGGGQGAGPPPPTLLSASNALMAAAMAMQGADVAPTAGQTAACDRARAQSADVIVRWTALKTTGLQALNAGRRARGQPELVIPR
ncbi:MAG TPA: hypothetical protein VI383_01265, partial [Gemmatimonadales bacterium]|nr:hypothetical protein [Gemmatimonadales bacterium]